MSSLATTLNCGKLLRAFTTTYLVERLDNTRGNDLEHGNNVKDWTIRIQAPKIAMADQGEGSETIMGWV